MGYLKEKYVREYFLGSIDKETGKAYGVDGFKSFKRGLIDDRYAKFLRNINLKNKVILDIGCGRGEVISYCAKNGCKKAVGIDFSREGLDIAREVNRDAPGVELIEMEAKDMEFKDEFDVVFLLDVIEHIPDEEMRLVYPKVYAALKDSGMVVLNTPIFNSSDDIDETNYMSPVKGMHCNKQTIEKLRADLKKNKFRQYALYVWGKSQNISLPIFLYVFKQNLDVFKLMFLYWMSLPGKAFSRAAKKFLNYRCRT